MGRGQVWLWDPGPGGAATVWQFLLTVGAQGLGKTGCPLEPLLGMGTRPLPLPFPFSKWVACPGPESTWQGCLWGREGRSEYEHVVQPTTHCLPGHTCTLPHSRSTRVPSIQEHLTLRHGSRLRSRLSRSTLCAPPGLRDPQWQGGCFSPPPTFSGGAKTGWAPPHTPLGREGGGLPVQVSSDVLLGKVL